MIKRGFMPEMDVTFSGHATVIFNPATVCPEFANFFPAVVIDPVDHLQKRLESASQLWPSPDGAERHVLHSLERDARVQGPSYHFHFSWGGVVVKGAVRKPCLRLHWDKEMQAAPLVELRRFVLSRMFPEGAEFYEDLALE